MPNCIRLEINVHRVAYENIKRCNTLANAVELYRDFNARNTEGAIHYSFQAEAVR